jgi:hypothetical protein
LRRLPCGENQDCSLSFRSCISPLDIPGASVVNRPLLVAICFENPRTIKISVALDCSLDEIRHTPDAVAHAMNHKNLQVAR